MAIENMRTDMRILTKQMNGISPLTSTHKQLASKRTVLRNRIKEVWYKYGLNGDLFDKFYNKK